MRLLQDFDSKNEQTEEDDGYLSGQLLIAMPSMPDPRFTRAVVYMCVHTPEGAMGLIINRIQMGTSFAELLKQLDIAVPDTLPSRVIHYGGPVESGRGFVLHSPEYERDSTVKMGEHASLTATIEVLQDMATGHGPEHAILTLGYVGWAPGQLDHEIQGNGWLTVEVDGDLLFCPEPDKVWQKALAKLGIRPDALTGEAGHA